MTVQRLLEKEDQSGFNVIAECYFKSVIRTATRLLSHFSRVNRLRCSLVGELWPSLRLHLPNMEKHRHFVRLSWCQLAQYLKDPSRDIQHSSETKPPHAKSAKILGALLHEVPAITIALYLDM